VAAAGALVAFVVGTTGASAVVITAFVIGAAAVPLLAIRLGRLPLDNPSAPVDGPRVFAAVARTDELLTGVQTGLVPAGLGAAVLLARSHGIAAHILVVLAAVAFLLRARLFVTVRQRVPLLVLGVGTLAPLAVAGAGGVATAALLALLGVGVAAAGGRYACRAPSPYLGRAADALDVLCVVSVLPVACAVLGLFARVRELVS
jgi:hypothetical protein